MDWTVYWFMLPACVVIASVAMFSGISGAALLTPLFLLGFPLLDVPTLTTVAAIGSALFLETFGFGSGVIGYVRRGLPDYQLLRQIAILVVPLGVLGAILARQAPAETLRAIYGVVMIVVAAALASDARRRLSDRRRGGSERQGPARSTPSIAGGAPVRGDPAATARARQWDADGLRYIRAADGRVYSYVPWGEGVTRALSGAGALLAGLISTGVGEATMPNLVRRVGMPVAIAAATSTLVVASTVVGAALAHLVQLAAEGGLSAIPWNLVVWAVPGAVAGAQLGARLQGRVDEVATSSFFAVLFILIGIAFLLSFTVFADALATG